MNRRLAQGIGEDAAAGHPVPVNAVVALGANLGDRAETMRQALAELARLPLVDEVRASPPIESIAVTLSGPDATAPAYLNAVAVLTTTLDPAMLLSLLHGIEERHGRERRERWGDRTLDLDLIAYADVVSDDPALLLPHPRAAERDFVLGPWLEVDPDAVLPGHGRVDALLAALHEKSDAAGGERRAGDAEGALDPVRDAPGSTS